MGNRAKLLADMEKTLFGSSNKLGVGLNELEKAQLGLVKLFMPEVDTRGVAAFNSFRDAYTHFTGDNELILYPRLEIIPQKVSAGLRACAAFTSSSFTYALQNVLSMYLSKIYKAFPYHEDILISDKKKADYLKTIYSIQLGYFGDLPDVDPEAGDYDNLEQYTDTESQYDLSQKGTILWITRKHLLNDSIDLVKAMVERIGRAARKTHAKYVWDFYINNSNCPDGTAWFTSGHGNLGSNALDFTPLVTAITALANMTEPSPSNTKIGLDFADFGWHLVVPIDLWDTAAKKNQTQFYYTANDVSTGVANPCYRLFGDHNERIIVCPFLTDTNDWGVIRNKEDVPIIEMSYLEGREEPDLVLATEYDLTEAAFLRDKLGYKCRHEYGGTVAEYRGGYKSGV
ncbi:MAG: hypothetical protein JRF50_12935 [Deltaproteobacteria bacterium]|nr:hypothetical protein [Deltaproteobacteria bacterium]